MTSSLSTSEDEAEARGFDASPPGALESTWRCLSPSDMAGDFLFQKLEFRFRIKKSKENDWLGPCSLTLRNYLV